MSEKGDIKEIDRLDDEARREAMAAAAKEAAEREKAMPFKEVLRIYYPGALWSMFLSTALIMEGYDMGIINAFYGQAAFKNHFGQTDSKGKKFVPANWQAGLNNGAQAGQIIGLFINGYCQSRFGSKRTYSCAMVLMAAAIFLPVFSKDLPMLLGGEIVCGVPWGIFQTLTTAYAAEVCPVALRGYLASFVNLCWGIGLFLAVAVIRACLVLNDNWGWRVPYIVQWAWPLPLFIGSLFLPESPRWLVSKGRVDEAKRVIRRLAIKGHHDEASLDAQVALIQHTDELEKRASAGSGYRDAFTGVNRRRLEITMVTWAIQSWSGKTVVSYASSFLQTAGMSQANAFNLNMVQNTMYIIGTPIYWVLSYRWGRRTIYMTGIAAIGLCHLIVGVIGFTPKTSGSSYGIGVILVLLNLSYNLGVGPACYTIVADMPSARVRPQSIALARVAYICSHICVAQLVPRMLQAQAWGWGARACMFWLGTCTIAFIYCYFRLPETKGRTFGELNILFENKVPARQFAGTKVDEFAELDDSSGVHPADSYTSETAENGRGKA